jgi:hypothetical protein
MYHAMLVASVSLCAQAPGCSRGLQSPAIFHLQLIKLLIRQNNL